MTTDTDAMLPIITEPDTDIMGVNTGNIKQSTDILNDATNKILAFLINNTNQSKTLQYIEDLLEHENFIIYFYVKTFAEKGIATLSRQSLLLALQNNSIHWISNTSVYNNSSKMNENGKLPMDYISAESGGVITSREEYARALEILVLKRYDEIHQIACSTQLDDIQELLEAHKMMAQMPIATKLLTNAYKMIANGDSGAVYLNRIKYTHREVLEYIRDGATETLARFAGSSVSDDSNDDRTNDILQMLAGKTSHSDPVFHWNIGEHILPNLLFGWVMFLSAPPKEGKTRFVIGEVVYPALCENRNVTYMSGEMDDSAIFATLVIKHLYASKGINLGSEKKFTKVINIIIMTSKIMAKTITKKEQDVFDSYPRGEIELVLTAFKELILSNKYGRLTIKSANLNSSGGNTNKTAEHEFIIENLEFNVLDDLRKKPKKHQCDLLVLDHAGHFVSNHNLNDVQIFRGVYQAAVRIAKNAIHPMGVVVVNHTNTQQGDNIKTVADMDEKPMKAFGSSEAGKSADIDLSLASTADQKKDGVVTLIVNFLRWGDVLEKFKTRTFPLIANKGTCDYTLQTKVKKPYLIQDPKEVI